MNQKKFEFQHKDLPFLKKDFRTRMLYIVLFVGVLIAQAAMLISSFITGKTSSIMVIISLAIIFISFMLVVLSLSFALRSLRLINVIRAHGYAVTAISVLPSMQKDRFAKIYALMSQILSVVMLIVLACGLTYSLLEFVYFTTFSFYLPLLLLVAIVGFNTVYHVNHEIKMVQSVKEYVPAY